MHINPCFAERYRAALRTLFAKTGCVGPLELMHPSAASLRSLWLGTKSNTTCTCHRASSDGRWLAHDPLALRSNVCTLRGYGLAEDPRPRRGSAQAAFPHAAFWPGTTGLPPSLWARAETELREWEARGEMALPDDKVRGRGWRIQPEDGLCLLHEQVRLRPHH